MKASKAATASFLVSAIQISCSARLAFACWLFGSLFRTLAVLCTQQRCSRVFGHTSPSAFQKPSAPSATASSGAIASPRRFRSSSRSRQDCALSRIAVGEADQLLLALWRGADDDQHALRVVLEPGLQMDAVGPEVDVALGGEIALAPARVLVAPDLLQPRNGRGRQPAGASLPSKRRPAPPRSRRWRCPSGRGSGSAPRGSSSAGRRAAGSPDVKRMRSEPSPPDGRARAGGARRPGQCRS